MRGWRSENLYSCSISSEQSNSEIASHVEGNSTWFIGIIMSVDVQHCLEEQRRRGGRLATIIPIVRAMAMVVGLAHGKASPLWLQDTTSGQQGHDRWQ